MSRRRRLLIVAACVLAALLAFHSVGFFVLLYPGLLTWSARELRPAHKLLLSLAFGCLFAGILYRWVLAFGVLAWLALTLVRGLPWLLYFLPEILIAKLAQRKDYDWQDGPAVVGGGLGLALVSAILLAGLTGVDWETPAACLTSWPTLLRPLPTVGLVGLALAIGLVANGLFARTTRWRATAVGVGLLWLLGTHLWPHHSSPTKPFQVALLQPGWAQSEKWEESNRQEASRILLDHSQAAAEKGASLVIWPETAWPYLGMRRRFTNTRKIGKLARNQKVDLLVSSIEVLPEDESRWRNSVSLVTSDGRFAAEYQKRRLAPFAEYIPLPENWEKRLRQRTPFDQISRYTAGDNSGVLTLSGGQRLGLMICYESMTPSAANEMADSVDFLVVVTNDAPFANSHANELHFRSAILRAIETQRPVLQASNTGVTGAVDSRGRVVSRTEPGFSGLAVELCNLELSEK